MTANADNYVSPLRLNPARANSQNAESARPYIPEPQPVVANQKRKVSRGIPGLSGKEYNAAEKHSPQVSIEYHAQHWFILVKASGRWTPLYHPTKKIQQQNQFGDVISTRPAIQTFPDFGAAYSHIEEHMPTMRLVKRSGWSRYFSNPVL